jgi:phosphoribosyl 1,2-cyclic phosphate phosphodiesterase
MSTDMAHKRLRPSVMFQSAKNNLIVDLSPDFKEQYMELSRSISKIPNALITHAHNDHIAGIGDFADMAFWSKQSVNVISPEEVSEMLKTRYPYLLRRSGVTFLSCNKWECETWVIDFLKVSHGHNGFSYGLIFNNGEKNGDISLMRLT